MPQLQSMPTYSLPSWIHANQNVNDRGDGSGMVNDPLANPSTDNAEFGDIGQFISTSITRAEKNAARLFQTANLSIEPQGVTQERKWYDLWGKTTDTLSAAGAAISSTLTKVIILVMIVAVIALFGMSYVQAKAGQLAK